jgi:ATP-binding cassette subfamily C protein
MRNRKLEKKGTGVVRTAFSLLPKPDKRKVIITAIFQASLSVLDLIGIGLVGILGALAVVGIQSAQPGTRIESVLAFLQLSQSTLQVQIAVIGGLAALVMIIKTILSLFVTRRILHFLSHRASRLTTLVTGKLVSQSIQDVNAKSSQEMIYVLTSGINSIMIGIIGTSVIFVADTFLLTIVMCALLYVDPLTSLLSALVFLSVGVYLYKSMSQKSHNLGMKFAELTILANQRTLEIMLSYRELLASNRRAHYLKKIEGIRDELAGTQAELNFFPNISKYALESAVVLAALAISASQFIFQDARHAVGTLAVFLAAGSRIAPAVLRLQQGAIHIRSSYGSAIPTFELIKKLELTPELRIEIETEEFVHKGFSPEIFIKDISYKFSSAEDNILTNFNLTIHKFAICALVGPSGSGKSTVLDLILGVANPSQGQVLVSGKPPLEAISSWPGAIAYVPQDVTVSMASIRENVCLGFDYKTEYEERILECLKKAQLSEFIENLPKGLNTLIGEGGLKLSGGEKQRLGIARALFTSPEILILDEATSSLDGSTESNLMDAIYGLKDDVTVLLVAHRLSSIIHADRIFYLENGRIEAEGTFDEVRKQVEDFDTQARAMGL